MTDDTLAQAIAAIKAGQRDVGKLHLQTVLRADPRNETAWLWMSGVVDTPQQKRDCLQRILALNPNNEIARKGLEQLGQSEAASFLSAFAPNTPAPTPPAPAPVAIEPEPATATWEPVPISFDDEPSMAATPIAQTSSEPIDLPPVAEISEAPCAFCGAPTGIDAICDVCNTEQVIDCPSCGRANDVRERWTCECGENLRLYLNKQGQLDRERLGDIYSMRDYPAAAVKQWKAAVEQHPKPQQLHRKIAEMYMKVGLIEQARVHNDLAKRK